MHLCCAVALFVGRESTCAAAGRPWGCRSRPMASTVTKGKGEDVADEGVLLVARPSREADPQWTRRACSRSSDAHPPLVAAAVSILVIRIQISDLRQGQSWSEFLSFCNEGKPHGSLQGGSRNLQVESLAKLREDEESTDLNVSLRVARANGVGDFSRLMLEIARARFECARVLSH